MVPRGTQDRSGSLCLGRSCKTTIKTELEKKKAERFAVDNLQLGDGCTGFIILSSLLLCMFDNIYNKKFKLCLEA